MDRRHVERVDNREMSFDIDLRWVRCLGIVIGLSGQPWFLSCIAMRQLTPSCRISYARFKPVRDTKDEESDNQLLAIRETYLRP
jgi:hypothetical protein